LSKTIGSAAGTSAVYAADADLRSAVIDVLKSVISAPFLRMIFRKTGNHFSGSCASADQPRLGENFD
jgi:hypothetical protein